MKCLFAHFAANHSNVYPTVISHIPPFSYLAQLAFLQKLSCLLPVRCSPLEAWFVNSTMAFRRPSEVASSMYLRFCVSPSGLPVDPRGKSIQCFGDVYWFNLDRCEVTIAFGAARLSENEWMNCITYILPVKPGGQIPGVYSLAVDGN